MPRSRSQAQSNDKDEPKDELPSVPTTQQEQERGVSEQDPKAQEKAQQTLEEKAAGGSTSQPAGGQEKLPEVDGKPQMRSSDGTTAEQGVQAPTDTVQVTETKGKDPDNEKQPAVSSVMPAQFDISDEDVLPPQSR